MSTPFNSAVLIDRIRNKVKEKALSMAKNRVNEIAEQQGEYLKEEFATDLVQSSDAYLVDKFEQEIKVNVVEDNETSFNIVIDTSGFNEHELSVLSTYYDNARRRAGI